MRLDAMVLDLFLVFCRTGTCFMIVPGLSTARVPARVRLYIAGVVALVIAPVVGEGGARPEASSLVTLVLGEMLAGAVIGIAARLIIEGLEFAGAAISSYIGLSWLTAGIDSAEPQPTLSTLIGALGALLLMILELPQHLVSALVQSYADMPRGVVPDTAAMLRHFTRAVASAFVVGLQVSAPFLVYGLLLNAMFGILGKLVPQMPAFFISAPFIMLGGLALLYLVSGQILHLMTISLGDVLRF